LKIACPEDCVARFIDSRVRAQGVALSKAPRSVLLALLRDGLVR
jgi:hypothetical protein